MYWIWLAALVVLISAMMPISPSGAQSSNPIVTENARAGTSDWRITNGATNHEIEGFASATSVNRGSQIEFFVNTHDPSYTIEVFRMGYYSGLGGRRETQPVTVAGTVQPIPSPDSVYGLAECKWSNPYSLTVWNPSDSTDWVSGVYLAKLTGTTSGKQAYIIFVVRDDSRASDVLFETNVNTYQAYNAWGGKSLYCYNSNSAPVSSVTTRSCSGGGVEALKVSFNRPYDDRDGSGEFFNWEYDTTFFLESQGYDLSYSTDVDTHTNAEMLTSTGTPLHKTFLSGGHDEYWSYEMRQNVTAIRDQGVSLGFLGANDIYWQIRYEPSTFDSTANYRTIVGYKENWQNDPDALNSATYYLVTARWRDPRYTYPGHPEDALIGVMYSGDEPVNADLVVSTPFHWAFANAGLQAGSHLTGLLGYEVDKEFGDQPANTVVLAHSPYKFNNGTHYSDMTIYQAASGAWVFATGSMQWAWGLSNASPFETSDTVSPSPAAQQTMINVMAALITPASLPAPGIGVRNVATSAPSRTTNSITVNVPTGTLNGDVMVAFIAAPVSSSHTITTPSGWTLVRRDAYNNTPSVNVAVYTRTASSEPASYTWKVDAKMNLAGAVASYYLSGGIDVGNGQGNPPGTSSIGPSVTIPAGHTRDLLIDAFSPSAGTGATIVTLPGTATSRWNFGPDGISLAMGDESLSNYGSTGNRIATLSTAETSVGQLVALMPN